MIQFFISDELPTEYSNTDIETLFTALGITNALNAVKKDLEGKTVTRIIVGEKFINIITK